MKLRLKKALFGENCLDCVQNPYFRGFSLSAPILIGILSPKITGRKREEWRATHPLDFLQKRRCRKTTDKEVSRPSRLLSCALLCAFSDALREEASPPASRRASLSRELKERDRGEGNPSPRTPLPVKRRSRKTAGKRFPSYPCNSPPSLTVLLDFPPLRALSVSSLLELGLPSQGAAAPQDD